MGEVAKQGNLSKIERIVAGRNEMLIALFDRTFASLSTAARRVFLMLSAWRSVLPQVAIEAVLLRNVDERVDSDQAIDELRRFSLIDVVESPHDKQPFIAVPLTAALYGREQLKVSPLRAAVGADLDLLRAFGAGQRTDVRHGVGPRIENLFRHLADKISTNSESLPRSVPMLRFLARQHKGAWLHLADLYREFETNTAREGEKEALRSYLISTQGLEAIPVWKRLALVCREAEDFLGEIHAWLEMCSIRSTPMYEVSRSVNRVNSLFRENKTVESEERKILLRKFVNVMEDRIADADGDDCSRLAWLYLQLGEEGDAYRIAELGLSRDPNNEHCRRIMDNLLEGRGKRPV